MACFRWWCLIKIAHPGTTGALKYDVLGMRGSTPSVKKRYNILLQAPEYCFRRDSSGSYCRPVTSLHIYAPAPYWSLFPRFFFIYFFVKYWKGSIDEKGSVRDFSKRRCHVEISYEMPSDSDIQVITYMSISQLLRLLNYFSSDITFPDLLTAPPNIKEQI